jgi:hypothetical protein
MANMKNEKYFDMSINEVLVSIGSANRDRLQDAFNHFIMRGVQQDLKMKNKNLGI